jgi:PAS domain S-box-containing protein
MESDIGRPLKHISHRLTDFDAATAADDVQQTGKPYKKNAAMDDGRWFLVRILPYHVGPRTVSGVVFTLVDITPLRESEEKYRQLAESAEAIFWEYDIPSDRWTYVAPQAERILGYPPHEWKDLKFWTDRLHPEDRSWAAQYCAECTARGEAHEFEYRLVTRDGNARWLRDVVNVDMRDGKPVKLRGFMIDIDGRKKTEEKCRYFYKLLADAEKTARMGSWTWDVDSDTVIWSENLFQLFGRDPALGAPSFAVHDQLYAPESMARLRQAVTEALEHGKNYELELTAMRADGSAMRCVARGHSEKNKNGDVYRLYGSLQEM